MKMRSMSLVMTICAIVVVACAKEEKAVSPDSTVVAASSGPGSAAALVSTTATVVDIDQKTRMVTLRTAENEIVHFHAPAEVRNLPQVKKGDLVNTTYYESLAIALRETKTEKPGMTVTESMERAPVGARPAGLVMRDVTLTAKVAAIDKKKQTVTLEGPQGGKVTLKVQDPANLERARVGNLVEATYREAVSISVEKPTK
jgi:hypothetical protein